MVLEKIPTFDEVKYWAASEDDLLEESERIDQLRLDFALDGVGLDDAFSETFNDGDNIVNTGGVSITTGAGGFAEMQRLLDIDDVITDEDTFSAQLNELENIGPRSEDRTVELTGSKVTDPQIESTTTESDTLDIDPRGTSDPEGAVMRLTGQRDEDSESRSETTASGFSIDVGGDNSPESESITIEGNGSTTSQSSSYFNTQSESDTISVGGTASPYSESVTIQPQDSPGDQQWSESLGANVRAVSASDGQVYVATSWPDKLWAFDESGNQQWTESFDESVTGVSGFDGRVYTGTDDDTLYAFDEHGNEQWSESVFSAVGQIFAVDGRVYTGGESRIRAFDESGNELWDEHHGTTTSVTAIGASDGRAYAGTDDDILYAFDEDGNELWSTDEPHDMNRISVSDGKIYVGAFGHGWLWAFDEDGNELWTENTDNSIRGVDALDGTVYAGGVAETLRAFDEFGNQQWTNSLGDNNIDGLAVSDAGIFVGSSSSEKLYGFSRGVFDPYVSVGSNTVSVSGSLDSTYSESISLSTGSESVSISSNGAVNVDIEWTEDHRVQDPSATVDGSTVSHSGPLASGETASGSVSISSPGSYSVDVSTNGGSPTVTAEWTEIYISKNPSIELDDGSETLAHAGELSEGQTIEEPISLTTGTHSATVSSDAPVLAEVEWADVHETVDPEIEIDSTDGTQTISFTGTIADGDVEDISNQLDETIVGGDVTITVHAAPEYDTTLSEVDLRLEAWPETAVVQLEKFVTDYVIKEMVSVNTVEGDAANVTHVVEDDNGNVEILDATRIDEFVEPNFDGENATVTLEIHEPDTIVNELALYVDSEVGT